MTVHFAVQSTRRLARRAAALIILLSAAACRDAAPPTPLAAAAASNDVDAMQALLAARPAPGAGELQVALAWAARHGASKTARTLLEFGARIDGGDGRAGYEWTPLITAVHTGHWATARDLLAWGADPNATGANGVTPLIMITNESDDEWHVRMVEDLLLAGADPRLATAEGATALSNAIAGGNAHIVARLVAAAPDLRLEEGFTGSVVGMLATLRGETELFERARGVRPPDEGWPPFLELVRDGTAEQALSALAAGADALARAPNGRSSLMVAAGRGEPELVRALLAAGVDPRVEDDDQRTALSHAVASGNAEAARLLLDAAPGLRLHPIVEDERSVFGARLAHDDELLALLSERGALP